MATDTTRQTSAGRWVPALPRGSAWWRLVERNFMVYRRSWLVFLVGFLEPVFYLFSIGVGVAGLVGDFTLDNGTVIGYTAFVAPGMLAASAMNGALYDATYNIFFKMKYAKLYDAILSTPLRPWDVALGEIAWALLRGTCYSAMFIAVMVVMGLTSSAWAVLALPAAMLVSLAFGGVGMALTTWMRSWQDFEFVTLAMLPMFLFSATFFPLSGYPDVIAAVVRWTPLYQGVVLCRDTALGSMGWECVTAAGYLAAMGSVGLYVASRRVGSLLLT